MGGRGKGHIYSLAILHIHEHKEVDTGKVLIDFANVKDRHRAFVCKISDNIMFSFYFSVRDRELAEFCKSCNLIGSGTRPGFFLS